jgi:hypothetical protein
MRFMVVGERPELVVAGVDAAGELVGGDAVDLAAEALDRTQRPAGDDPHHRAHQHDHQWDGDGQQDRSSARTVSPTCSVVRATVRVPASVSSETTR